MTRRNIFVTVTAVTILAILCNVWLGFLVRHHNRVGNRITREDYLAAKAFVNNTSSSAIVFVWTLAVADCTSVPIGERTLVMLPLGDVITNRDGQSNLGTYWQHHNYQMLQYAAYEFCYGNAEFALQLLRALSESGAALSVYFRGGHPMSLTDINQMSLADIYKIAMSDTKAARALLAHEAEMWEQGTKRGSPTRVGP